MRLRDAAIPLARVGVMEYTTRSFSYLEIESVCCTWRPIGWYTFFSVPQSKGMPVVIDTSGGNLPVNWFSAVEPWLQAL